MLREKKAAPRQKMRNGEPTQKDPAQMFTFPAPVRGWVLNENAAQVQPGSAKVLDNFICTTTGIKARGGAFKHATLNAAVTSLFRYDSGSEILFGATASEITDISAPADPDVAVTADVTGQTSGDYTAQQFGTAGGDYLYAVNGADKPQLFDGSTWTAIDGASTPAITGVTTTAISHVWSYANRLFFVEKNTMTAHYLPVDSIGGAVSQFSLAGVFKKGGSLLFGASWSMDAGDGLDDKCVFVSTEGEIAVYQGTNPGSASEWSLAGRYDMPRPLGKNSHIQTGGDLLVATEAGLIPVSAALRLDVAAQTNGAVSARIAPYWQDNSQPGAEMVKLPAQNILLVSQPGSLEASMLCVNLQTGAWSRFTGWDAECMSVFGNFGFYGNADGAVYRMNSGGSDDGSIYTCRCLYNFDGMGAYGQTKTARQARYTFQSGGPYTAKLVMKANFDETVSSPPPSPDDYTIDAWDVGEWDVAEWDSSQTIENSANWVSVFATGAFLAPELQLTFGVTPTPNVELVSIDVTYNAGAVVT